MQAVGLPGHTKKVFDAMIVLGVVRDPTTAVFKQAFGNGLPSYVRSLQIGMGEDDQVFPAKTVKETLGNSERSDTYVVKERDHNWPVKGALKAAVMIMRQLGGQTPPSEI
jgi:hypothetical protein